MDFESFQKELAEILGVDAVDVEQDTALSSLKGWDSMSVLLYMSLVDEKFGRNVSPDAIESARTVEDLYRLAIETS